MACYIERSPSGKPSSVLANNGNPSELYTSLLSVPFIENGDEAVELYGKIIGLDFLKQKYSQDNNGEPILYFMAGGSETNRIYSSFENARIANQNSPIIAGFAKHGKVQEYKGDKYIPSSQFTPIASFANILSNGTSKNDIINNLIVAGKVTGKKALQLRIKDLVKSYRSWTQKNNQNVKFQVIGENGLSNLSKNNNENVFKSNLEAAKKLEKEFGVYPSDWLDNNVKRKEKLSIKRETGWERNATQEWVYEVEDISINPNKKQQILNSSNSYSNSEYFISDLFYIPRELTIAYPNILKLKINFTTNEAEKAQEATFKENNITINTFNYKEGVSRYENERSEYDDWYLRRLLQAVVHEFSHFVDTQEGFSTGGNPLMFDYGYIFDGKYPNNSQKKKIRNHILELSKLPQKDRRDYLIKNVDSENLTVAIIALKFSNPNDYLNALFDKSKTTFEKYEMLGGEITARNIASSLDGENIGRLFLSKEERASSLLSDTEDILRINSINLKMRIENVKFQLGKSTSLQENAKQITQEIIKQIEKSGVQINQMSNDEINAFLESIGAGEDVRKQVMNTLGEEKQINVNGQQLTVKTLPEGIEIVNGFYSPIEKNILELKSNKWGNGKDAWGEISKSKGFKKDEAKWTGIEEWLKSQGKVTKQDILDYMKNNRVQIVEVVKGRDVETEPNKDYEDLGFNKPKSNLSTQHSIEITPELKAAVEKGVPLFQKQSIKTNLKDLTDKQIEDETANIINGESIFKRFSQKEHRGFIEAGEHHVRATLLANRLRESSEENSTKWEAQAEKVLEKYAKDKNIWLDLNKYGEPNAIGAEAYVWFNENNKKVIKALGYSVQNGLDLLLDKITIHNTLFPATKLKVIGFAKDKRGDFNVVVEQPLVIGKQSTGAAVREYFRNIGLSESSDYDLADIQYTNNDYIISDMHLGNVIKTPKGNLAVIDGLFYLNNAESGYGSDRVLDNSIESSPTAKLSSQGIKMIPNGFVYRGEIYLNTSVMTPQTPIHEASHLFLEALKKNKPEIYAEGIRKVEKELGKKKSEIQSIIQYVEKTQPNLTGEAKAEEILAELTGRKGYELIQEQVAKKGGILEYIQEIWQELKQMLGLSQYSYEEVMNMSLSDYARNIGVDVLSGRSMDEIFKKDTDNVYKTAQESYDFEDFLNKMSDFRDAHSAPSKDTSSVEEKIEEGGDFSLREVSQGFHNQPADYFDPKVGARYYGYNNIKGMQSFTAINNIIRGLKTGKKDLKITTYRAKPKSVNVNELKDYDWVTFSKEYAIAHGEHRFGENEYDIIEQEVSIDDLWWDGNDINEWGYDTGNTKQYSKRELKEIWDSAQENKVQFSQQKAGISLEEAIKRNNGYPLNLAPNGKPSILYKSYQDLGYSGAELDALVSQVYSDNFLAWFGDWINDPQNASKVVDANGQPLIVWHGTNYENFNEFFFENIGSRQEDDRGLIGEGFYFAKNKDYAIEYGTNVRPFFLNSNIYDVEKDEKRIFLPSIWQVDVSSSMEITDMIKNIGYNGSTIEVAYNTGREYAVFSPSQIKSATNNVGIFSNESNDIRFSIVGEKGANEIEQYKSMLDEAKRMEANGYNYIDIESKTGWYKYQGQWRMLSKEAVRAFKDITLPKINKKTNLKKILGNENILLKMYPSLGEIDVVLLGRDNKEVPQDIQDIIQNVDGIYSQSRRSIYVNSYSKSSDFQNEMSSRFTLIHEIQHVIQREENMPIGGDLSTVMRKSYSIMGFNENVPYLDAISAIKNRDKSNFSDADNNILDKSISNMTAIIGRDEKKLNKDYNSLMGEIDSRIAERALNSSYLSGDEYILNYSNYLESQLYGLSITEQDIISIYGSDANAPILNLDSTPQQELEFMIATNPVYIVDALIQGGFVQQNCSI